MSSVPKHEMISCANNSDPNQDGDYWRHTETIELKDFVGRAESATTDNSGQTAGLLDGA